MKLFSLPNDNLMLLTAELNDKQLMKFTNFKRLALPYQKLEI
jgi:hypothetical protein